jgi:hypothetical protein
MADDAAMRDWWGWRSDDEKRDWCQVVAGGGTITTAMVDTVPKDLQSGEPGTWLTWYGTDIPDSDSTDVHWNLMAEFRDFLGLQCGS